MLVLAVLMYAWVGLQIGEIAEHGLAYIGWVILFAFFAYLMAIRIAIRDASEIEGSMFEDALAVIFVYPLAVDQMHEHIFFGHDAQGKRKQDKDIGLDNRGQVNGTNKHDRVDGEKIKTIEDSHF